jgi:hypothetical protein
MSDEISRLSDHYRRKGLESKAQDPLQEARYDSALDFIITSMELGEAFRKADEQTKSLLRSIFVELKDRLSIDTGAKEAIQRLFGLKRQQRSWDAASIRNNVFKAAHSLGMDLPSSSF